MFLSQNGIIASNAKPVFEVAPDTLLFSFIIFGVLLAVLYKFAWGPIVEGLELREKKMADDIEGARTANEKAQAQLAAYDAKIAGAESEAAALIAEAKNDALAAKDKSWQMPHKKLNAQKIVRWLILKLPKMPPFVTWPNQALIQLFHWQEVLSGVRSTRKITRI